MKVVIRCTVFDNRLDARYTVTVHLAYCRIPYRIYEYRHVVLTLYALSSPKLQSLAYFARNCENYGALFLLLFLPSIMQLRDQCGHGNAHEEKRRML